MWGRGGGSFTLTSDIYTMPEQISCKTLRISERKTKGEQKDRPVHERKKKERRPTKRTVSVLR